MKQNLEELIEIINEEQFRIKLWMNENRFHHGTAPFIIAKRYRDELKQYLRLILDDKADGDYSSYCEMEDRYDELKDKYK